MSPLVVTWILFGFITINLIAVTILSFLNVKALDFLKKLQDEHYELHLQYDELIRNFELPPPEVDRSGGIGQTLEQKRKNDTEITVSRASKHKRKKFLGLF